MKSPVPWSRWSLGPGVGKATIYRHWSTKDDLIVAAIQDRQALCGRGARARRQLVRAMLPSGIDRGALRPDLGVELMADMHMGPIILRKILRELGGNGEELAKLLVDSLLEGWRA